MKSTCGGGQIALRAITKPTLKHKQNSHANTFNSTGVDASVYQVDMDTLVVEQSEEVSTSPTDNNICLNEMTTLTFISSSPTTSLSSLPITSSAAIATVVNSVSKSDSRINQEIADSRLHNIRLSQMNDSNRTSSFICPVCKRSFSSEKYLSMHLSLHKPSHLQAAYNNGATPVVDSNPGGPVKKDESKNSAAKPTWTCKFCGKLFTQNSSYRNHMRTHSDERPYPCTICSIGFKEKYHLKKHVLYKHSTDLKERCRICGKPFKDSTAVRAHERIHSEVRPYRCNICGKSFKTSECLWHHENRSKTCGKAIAAIQSDINQNELLSGESKPRARRARRAKTDSEVNSAVMGLENDMNDLENQKFSSSLTVEEDVEMKFNKLLEQQKQQINLNQIIIQQQQQPQVIKLRQDIDSSRPTQPPYRYINIVTTKPSQELKPEVVTSLESFGMDKIEPAMCPKEWFKDLPMDGSYSDTLNSLSSDSEGSSTQDAFSEIADSDIPSPSESISSSEALFSNASKLLCFICGKKFLSKQTLNKHVITMHSQDRPYRCHLCDNGFKLKVHLKKHHLYRHSNEYPCECTICGKRFKDTSAVRLHERIHSLVRPFECPCGKSFKTRENLWGHRNRGPCEAAEDFVASNMRLFRSTEFGPILGVPISSAAVLQQLNGLLELQRLETVTSVASISPDSLNSQTSEVASAVPLNGSFETTKEAKTNLRSNFAATTMTSLSSSPSVVPTAVVMPLHRTGVSSDKKGNSGNQTPTVTSSPIVSSSNLASIASQLLNSSLLSNSNLDPIALSNLISNISSLSAFTGQFQQTTSNNLVSTGSNVNSSLFANNALSFNSTTKSTHCGTTLASIPTVSLSASLHGSRHMEMRNSTDDSADDDEPKLKRKALMRRQPVAKKITIRSQSDAAIPRFQAAASTGFLLPDNTQAGSNTAAGSLTWQQLQQLQQLLHLQNNVKSNGCLGNNFSSNADNIPSQTLRSNSDGEELIYLDDINLGASEDLSTENIQLMSWSDPVLPTGDFLLDDFSCPSSPCLSDYDLAGVKLLDQSDPMSDMNLFGSDDLYSNWSSDEEAIFSGLSPSLTGPASLLL